jgi:hypothetical protein
MKNTKIGFFVETNEEGESNIINELEKLIQTGFGDGRTVEGICDDDCDSDSNSQDDGKDGKSDGRPVRMVKDSSITKK